MEALEDVFFTNLPFNTIRDISRIIELFEQPTCRVESSFTINLITSQFVEGCASLSARRRRTDRIISI